jgi:SAM-dependent methyltransferase
LRSISEAAVVAFIHARNSENCSVIRADLIHTPFKDELFDLIIADGVPHHLPDTEAAVRALYRKLRPGGEFFLIFKKMGVARYFCDEHIRSEFQKQSPETCLAACQGLADLGRELSRFSAKITLTNRWSLSASRPTRTRFSGSSATVSSNAFGRGRSISK